MVGAQALSWRVVIAPLNGQTITIGPVGWLRWTVWFTIVSMPQEQEIAVQYEDRDGLRSAGRPGMTPGWDEMVPDRS
ncbi:hypothetical protein P8C59_008423 [Phyllachora maydis]|uniref:Uncharacterized protein n=1 Tax=Phyllachora maydis TaxID=1825666 RepID=A0AAD9IBD8_9PEZI|nr:hypothetical protein P8C59_008423 [Phyllachora maydis]